MNSKEKLLLAAKKLFSERGYHETRIDDIVAEAGLSKGAFYFYFKSKEDIFRELVLDMSKRMIGLLKSWVDKDLGVEEILRGHIAEFLQEFYKDRHIAYIFLFQLAGTNDEFRKIYYEKTKKVREILTHLVEKGIRKGEFKYSNAENIVNLLMGYVRIVYLEYILKETKSLDEILCMVEEGLDVIFRGIKS